jgi:hypothetical protein
VEKYVVPWLVPTGEDWPMKVVNTVGRVVKLVTVTVVGTVTDPTLVTVERLAELVFVVVVGHPPLQLVTVMVDVVKLVVTYVEEPEVMVEVTGQVVTVTKVVRTVVVAAGPVPLGEVLGVVLGVDVATVVGQPPTQLVMTTVEVVRLVVTIVVELRVRVDVTGHVVTVVKVVRVSVDTGAVPRGTEEPEARLNVESSAAVAATRKNEERIFLDS